MKKPISYKAQQRCYTLDKYNVPTSQREFKDGEIKNMATLREEAQAYEPPQTLNIADLDKIPIDIELKDGKGKTKEGEDFSYKYAVIDSKEYRVAGSIIGGIKALMEKIPDLQFVAVIRQGMGQNTRYQVIPLPNKPIEPAKEEKVE